MAINIQKRTRSASTDAWGAWTITTEAPSVDGYLNTELVQYQVSEATQIDINEFTNGTVVVDGIQHTWTGTGIFDVIMRAVNGNVSAEYDNGRIVGPAYSQVYLGALQTAIGTAAQLLLGVPDTESKVDTNKAQKVLLEKQQLLVERQARGFDDDAKQKLLKQALDSWSVAYSVAQDANSIPDSIKVNVIDSIMKNAYTALGITKTNDPIGEA